jgi:CRP/FNR family transcriptional regulator, nitrogen fixation regulation protein
MNLTEAKTFNPATAVMSFSPPDSTACRDRPLAALERLAILGRYDTGEPVYRCNDSIEHWYRLVSGAARLGAVSGDGRRHIVDFVFPGDFFGFAGFGSRQFCVEAMVAGTLVARYPRSSAERLADADPQTARNIRKAAFQSIARMQRRMVMLGQTSALEKVSAFLLEMSDRSHHCASSAVFLPMSRYDIADYLAMAVETVSRTLTELRIRQTIAFRGVRHVCICNRNALAALASGLSVC